MTQPHEPRPENRFIATLSAEETAALRPLLRRVEVTFDQTVVDQVFRQEELARLIGTRRSTISEAASELKRRKLIAYGRGVIRITDHAGLEAAACDCYRMLRPRMAEALGIDGPS